MRLEVKEGPVADLWPSSVCLAANYLTASVRSLSVFMLSSAGQGPLRWIMDY